MPIEFICPSTDCNKKLSVSDEKAGKKVRCPKCREVLVAPLKSGDSARTIAADGTLASDERTALDHLEPVLELRGKAKKTLDSEEEIAQGGMGKVMLCHDQSLERSVAMKIMRVGIADSQEHRLRFLEEAQVTGQLEHPNIVPVHDLGKDEEGNLYFTMKHVKGRSLGELLSDLKGSPSGDAGYSILDTGKTERRSTSSIQYPVSLPHLLNVFLKACDAMAFAHSKGVIHRDLKPDNIMVGDYGEVLVMDWGLAKVDTGFSILRAGQTADSKRSQPAKAIREAETLIDGGQASSSQPPASSNQHPVSVSSVRSQGDVALTMECAIQGTPAYMPPEQALGRLDEIDHRSDVYSLGAILYEILTLQRPFTGKTANEILVKVTEDRLVAPIKRAPERNIPKELAAIAVKAMAHDRRRRYQSVGELQQDINLYLEGRAVSAKDDSAIEAISKLIKRNKTASLAVAGAFVVILLLTAFFVVRLQREVDIALANEKKAQASEQKAIAARTEVERAKDAQRKTALKASRRFALRAIDAAKQQLWLEADRRREDAESVAADSPWPPYARGMFEELKNNYGPAKALYQKALSLDANCKEAQLALAGLKTLEGEIADASKLLSGLADETDWKNLLKIGRLFTKTGKWKESVDVYRRALDLMKNAKDAAREKETKEFQDLVDGAEYAMVDARARLACVGFYESVKHLKGNKLFRRIDAKVKEINGIEKPMRGDWWMMGQQFMRAGYGEQIRGIRFLYPLRGLPIQELTLIGTQMRNADSLAGLPVKRLSLIYNRRLQDISGLRGMPVVSLRIHACPVADISPLKGMELNHLELWGAKVRDISPLAGMPLVNVSFKNSNRIKDLTPLEGAPLKSLAMGLTPVSDLSPLRNMPLEKLAASNTPIKDLSPLSGLKLKILSLDSARISDLSPLKGVPLEALNLSALRGGTLEALRGMPLKALTLDRISFKLDLSPLAQSPLERLSFVKGGTADITPIRELKTLKSLRFDETQVEDLSPLSSLQLEVLSFSESQVTDISPLAGLPLKELMMNKNRITEIGALKKVTTLEKLHMQYLKVTDLSPLTDLKNLAELDMKGVPAISIRPLAALRIKALHIHRMPLTDLTPLATIRPRVLTLSEKNNYSKESLETVKELTGEGTKVTWDKM